MKYGFSMTNRGPLAKPDHLVTLARRAEELGFDTLFIPDHIVLPNSIASRYPYSATGQYPGEGSQEALEQLTVLSFLAGATKTIRLVTSVMVVPHRSPLLAAKMLSTLDVLSKGRLVVGVGAGWMREEFEALGLPPFEERGAVTDEYIAIFKELWTSDRPSFQGKYCSFDDLAFLPKPVQQPHPPIWVGGESPAAIRRAARHGDGWYPIGRNPVYPLETSEQVAGGLKRFGAAVRRAGRDPKDIDIVYRIPDYHLQESPAGPSAGRQPFQGTAADIAGDIRAYEEMGVGRLVVDFRNVGDVAAMLQTIEEFATVVRPGA